MFWQLDKPLKPNAQLGAWPRITPTGFTIGIILTYALAVVATAYRTVFRIRYFKKLYLDDYVLFLGERSTTAH